LQTIFQLIAIRAQLFVTNKKVRKTNLAPTTLATKQPTFIPKNVIRRKYSLQNSKALT